MGRLPDVREGQLLFPGRCRKCGATRTRFQEWDIRARGRRFVCMICGYTECWLKPDGRVYVPPPWVEEGVYHAPIVEIVVTDGAISVALTPSEKALIRLAAQDKSLREIAQETGSAVNTIRSHFQRLHTKLGVGSRFDLVATAIKIGAIECPYCLAGPERTDLCQTS
jgi:DNA-binding CsgD family transcriptional regulator